MGGRGEAAGAGAVISGVNRPAGDSPEGEMSPEGEDGNGARGAVVPGNKGGAGAVGGGGTAGFAIDVRGEFTGGAGLRMTGGVIS
jgi:hypothetical protein